LLDSKKGQQLANECKNAEQMKAAAQQRPTVAAAHRTDRQPQHPVSTESQNQAAPRSSPLQRKPDSTS
jgi:hypothetical protein